MERCAALLHLVDGTEDDVVGAYRTVRGELDAYGGGLSGKAEIIALNKVDALDEEAAHEKAQALEGAAGAPVVQISRRDGTRRQSTTVQTLRPLPTGTAEVEPSDDIPAWTP